jgi:hypothetical protein
VSKNKSPGTIVAVGGILALLVTNGIGAYLSSAGAENLPLEVCQTSLSVPDITNVNDTVLPASSMAADQQRKVLLCTSENFIPSLGSLEGVTSSEINEYDPSGEVLESASTLNSGCFPGVTYDEIHPDFRDDMEAKGCTLYDDDYEIYQVGATCDDDHIYFIWEIKQWRVVEPPVSNFSFWAWIDTDDNRATGNLYGMEYLVDYSEKNGEVQPEWTGLHDATSTDWPPTMLYPLAVDDNLAVGNYCKWGTYLEVRVPKSYIQGHGVAPRIHMGVDVNFFSEPLNICMDDVWPFYLPASCIGEVDCSVDIDVSGLVEVDEVTCFEPGDTIYYTIWFRDTSGKLADPDRTVTEISLHVLPDLPEGYTEDIAYLFTRYSVGVYAYTGTVTGDRPFGSRKLEVNATFPDSCTAHAETDYEVQSDCKAGCSVEIEFDSGKTCFEIGETLTRTVRFKDRSGELTDPVNMEIVWVYGGVFWWITDAFAKVSTGVWEYSDTIASNTPLGTWSLNAHAWFQDGCEAGTQEDYEIQGASLCTKPDLLYHDFGDVLEGQQKQWSFQITNCGSRSATCGSTLGWEITADQTWITKIEPASGSSITDTETVTVTIDTTGLQPCITYEGTITLTSNAGTKTGTIKVHVASEPEIDITRSTVERHGTGFSVALNIKNSGDTTASNIQFSEYVKGFQALSDAKVGNTTTTISPSYDKDTKKCEVSFTIPELKPSASDSITYYIIPILFEDATTYTIGEDAHLSYEGPTSNLHEEEPSIEVTQVKVEPGTNKNVAEATDYAIKQSDYLIVTNSTRLDTNLPAGMQSLLSTMAKLAYLKDGVLGYLSTYDRYILDDLIEAQGDWAKKMSSAFSQAGDGYLLIVGETEIVPAWDVDGFGVLEWVDETGQKRPVDDIVPDSDHPYADTTGDSAPELVVGRVIGNNCQRLKAPLDASIGVYEGSAQYEFDRSHALLVSGTDADVDRQAGFINDINAIEKILEEKGTSVTKIHWANSCVLTIFERDYEQHDGFCAGDVTGDDEAEIIIGDRGDHIYILDKEGSVVVDFDRDFEEGDGLAIGDVTGDDKEEIIMGDRSEDKIYLYNGRGTRLSYFTCDFEGWDGFVVGDVTGNNKAEIIHADRSTDEINIYGANGSDIGNFHCDFEQHDGFAVCDVRGDDKGEIIIGDRSKDKIRVFDASGLELATFDRDFEEGDRLAAGDFTWDPGYEIIMTDISEDRIYIYSLGAVALEQRYSFGWATLCEHCGVEKYDGLTAGDVAGGWMDEIIVGDRDDFIRIIETSYKDQKYNSFTSTLSGMDILVFRDHGHEDLWDSQQSLDAGNRNHFPLAQFGNVSPVILSFCCNTGDYESGDDANIAEAFLEAGTGAAAFIGSTNESMGYSNSQASRGFLENWNSGDSIGDTFYDLKKTKYSSAGKGTETLLWWKMWLHQYNLYGDPKFGATTGDLVKASTFATETPPNSAEETPPNSTEETPPISLEVEVPDYDVTTIEGFDYVEIPGGHLLLESGEYQIPYYSVSVDYPKGHRVQDVILIDRSGLVTDTGFKIPISVMSRNSSPDGERTYSGSSNSWIPDKKHEWQTIDNPDGSTTLVIAMFPFYYNPATTDVQFYKNYSFEISYVFSSVEITNLVTDSHDYEPGTTITINVGVDNLGEAQDVVINTFIIQYGSDEIVDSLASRTVDNLSRETSCLIEWNSTGVAPGYYYVEATANDVVGNLLDRETEMFRLGISSGEITGFSVTPELFDIGDSINIILAFSNTGTVNIKGTAVAEVQDKDGKVIKQFRHDFTDLTAADSVIFDDTWDTSGAVGGLYRIVGYVLYDAKSTDVISFTVTSTDTTPPILVKAPVVSFTFSPGNPLIRQAVTFDSSASYHPVGEIASYEWNFGDGAKSSGMVVTHTYAMAGDYAVSLTATSDDGVSATYSTVVQVREKQRGLPVWIWIAISVVFILTAVILVWRRMGKKHILNR